MLQLESERSLEAEFLPRGGTSVFSLKTFNSLDAVHSDYGK